MTRRERIGRWIVAVVAATIAIATLTPVDDSGFGGSALCIVCGELGGVDAVQNILLFMPLGIGLALAGVRASAVMLLTVSGTLAIELLQFRVVSGRDASAGDLLMNSLGGAIGFLLARNFSTLVLPSRRAAAWLTVGWTLIFLALQLIGAWTLVPALTPPPYYGQIARDLGYLTGFPGTVLHPMIGPDTILNWGATPARTRDLLARPTGALVSANVVPFGCPSITAVIIRLADTRQREVLLLGQRGADLIYGLRTGAEALRFRPRRYRIADVFGRNGECSAMTGEIGLRARLRRSTIELRAQRKDMSLARDLTPEVGDAWRLFTPWQTYADGGAAGGLLTTLWIAGLLVPLGYWGAATQAGGGAGAWTVISAWLALVIGVGLVAIPGRFGLPTAGAWTWVGAIVGATAGLVLRVSGSRHRLAIVQANR